MRTPWKRSLFFLRRCISEPLPEADLPVRNGILGLEAAAENALVLQSRFDEKAP